MILALPILLVFAFAVVDQSRGNYQAQPAPPSPIVVLDQMAMAGQTPPPFVIMCAIAQAEALGLEDLAHDIVKVFVGPVVRGARARAPQAAPARPALANLAPRRAPAEPPAMLETPSEIPEVMAMRPMPVAVLAHAHGATEPSDTRPSATGAGGAGDRSPIDGVPARAWQTFVDKLARETPAFCTERHVGAYRQRKERLAELGIDPNEVLGSLAAQRAALDRDIADACHHVRASGLASEHVSRLISVPGQPGQDGGEPHAVTLSGVLGVVQAAGLEGAVGWLERPRDRKQYPHTTVAFLRTNGVF